jgi:hypothetical protein
MANEFSGQPGNAVPLITPASTNEVNLGYAFWSRVPLKSVSTVSTATRIASSDAYGVQTFGGQSSAQRVFLPPPAAGLKLMFASVTAPVGSATIFYVGSTVGGVDILKGGGSAPTTSRGVQLNSTANELGQGLMFIGLSATRWLFLPLGTPVSSAFTSDTVGTAVSLWNTVAS